MKHVKPPSLIPSGRSDFKIFLAGSIEQGKADHWQERIAQSFCNLESNFVVFNPRRDNWDADLEQSTNNSEFVTQVTWEINHIELADLVIFFFDPKTTAPITLFELGVCAQKFRWSPYPPIVYCPEGYFRKGNVDIYCEIYGMKQVQNENDLITEIHNSYKFHEKN